MNEVVNEVVAAGHPRHSLQLAARQQMGVVVVAARQQRTGDNWAPPFLLLPDAASTPAADAVVRSKSSSPLPRITSTAAVQTDRYTTTARLLHNAAIDAASCEEAAKRPCVDLMLFYANQVCSLFMVSSPYTHTHAPAHLQCNHRRCCI